MQSSTLYLALALLVLAVVWRGAVWRSDVAAKRRKSLSPLASGGSGHHYRNPPQPKFDPAFALDFVGNRTAGSAGLRLDEATRKWRHLYPSFVAIDLETTGRGTASCKIIEIALIEFRNGKPISEFVSFVNPGVSIPPPATRKNNITDAMVRGAPSFEVVAKDRRFVSLLEKPLVGHNLQFDLDVLRNELNRIGSSLSPQWGFCTMRRQLTPPSRGSSSKLEPGRYNVDDRWRRLDFAMGEWRVARTDRLHRARADALAAGEVACRMIEAELSEESGER